MIVLVLNVRRLCSPHARPRAEPGCTGNLLRMYVRNLDGIAHRASTINLPLDAPPVSLDVQRQISVPQVVTTMRTQKNRVNQTMNSL